MRPASTIRAWTLAVACLGAALPADAQEDGPTRKRVFIQVEGKSADRPVGLGERAPIVDADEWLNTVERSADEQIRVVHFWASWCQPCLEAIPPLSGIQTEYADRGVSVAGITWPDPKNTRERVDALLTKRAGQLRYAIGWDADGSTAKRWLGTETKRTLPISFVVDAEGRVVFRGHPMWLRAPIEGVLAGTWDVERDNRRLDLAREEWGEIYRASGDRPDRVVTLAEGFRARYPLVAHVVDGLEFEALIALDRGEQAATVGRWIVDRAAAQGDALLLNNVAWMLVDPQRRLTQRDLGLAHEAATAAVEMTGAKDAYVLDTLARVHAWRGEFEQALKLQKQAVAILDEPQLRVALIEYERALARGD